MPPRMKFMLIAFVIINLWYAPSIAEDFEITAEGKYVMGDLDSKKDAKMLALMEAKRMALEKAGTYIESISEVENYQLTKDQINSLAAGIMSVEVLKEDWKISGENMVLIIYIRATIDASNLKNRIASMQDIQNSESSKEIQNQLAALQKELADLKAQQATMATIKDKAAPSPEIDAKHAGIMEKMSAMAYLEEGHSALRVGNWNKAIEAYSQALALDPNLADAHGGMSLALQLTGKPEKALKAANMGLKVNPQKALSHTAMARILYFQGKYGNALESINKSIELWKKSAYSYLLRGEIYNKLQKPKLALINFDQSCKMGLPRACQRAKSQ